MRVSMARLFTNRGCFKFVTAIGLAIGSVGTVVPSPAVHAADEEPVFKRYPRSFAVGSQPVSLVLADLNGDGKPEIITANRGHLTDPGEEVPANDEVSVLIAGDDLVYRHGAQLETGFAPYDIEAVNVDGQRALDLVVVNFMSRRGRDLSMFRNLGEFRFEPLHYSVPTDALTYRRHRYSDDTPLFTLPGLTSVAVARLDGDEFRDAVATGWSSDVLVYFRGSRETYFEAPSFLESPGGPRDIQIADLDKDGDSDLVTVQYSSSEIALWLGDGEGGFEEVKRFPSGGTLPNQVRLVDMDRNGWLDLVVSHRYTEDNVVIWYGREGLRYDRMLKLEAGEDREALEHDIRDIAVADFDLNGWLDIAASCPVSRECMVWFQEQRAGSGTSFRQEIHAFKESDGEPYALAADDVDGDGDTDLGIAMWRSNEVTFLLSNAAKE